MKKILSRKSSGKTKVEGEKGQISFKVPKDRSALGLITTGGNYPEDGDDFREDGYVYSLKTKKRLRKWFIRLGSNIEDTIWEPKLQNIVFLESRRWYFYQKAKAWGDPAWEKILAKIQKAGHFYGYHKFCETGKGDLEFNKYGVSEGISWDWCKSTTVKVEGKVERKPKKNQKLVDEWFAYEDYAKFIWKPYQLYNMAFLDSVDLLYRNKRNDLEKNNIHLHLVINGRNYWFALNVSNRYANGIFTPISFPEQQQHIIIKGTANG